MAKGFVYREGKNEVDERYRAIVHDQHVWLKERQILGQDLCI